MPLVELVRRCLEKEPAKRPQSAAELVHGLDQALVSSGARALGWRQSSPPPPPKTNRTMRALAFGGRVRRRHDDRVGHLATCWRRSPRDSLAPSPSFRSRTSAAATAIATSAKASPTSSPARSARCPGCVSRRARRCSRSRARGWTPQQIAKTLKVSSLLEGTIRRSGERLRVTAQLTNASDGLALWSDTYERQMKDVFQVQDDIAGSIAGALRMALAPSPNGKRGLAAGTAPAGTEDLAAYDLYLRGRYFWHQRGNDALHRAADYFGQAIDRDPTFARAYAGLADALGLLPIYGTTPADSAFPLARKAAEKALSLDSTLAEAHTTLGLILKSTGEWEPAAAEFRRGLALDSTYATGHQWYAEVLIITGRVREAVTELERARDLEPLSPVINAELGYTFGLGGRYQEGMLAGQRAVELDSTLWIGHAFLAFTHAFAGEYPAAVTGFRRATSARHRGSIHSSDRSHSRSRRVDKPDSARAVLASAEARAKGRGGSPVAMAMGYTGLGDRDAALIWLERARA